MYITNKPRHTGKRLLIAALGVATVSFVGCAADTSSSESDVDGEYVEDEANQPEAASVQGTQQALTPTHELELVKHQHIRLPPPAGNLMATPINRLRDRVVIEQALRNVAELQR